MQHISHLITLFIGLALSLCVSSLQAQNITAQGQVLSRDSTPQANFKVQLNAQSYLLSASKTDSLGEFSFTNLTISKCQISINRLGVRKEFFFEWDSTATDTTFSFVLMLDFSDSVLQQQFAQHNINWTFVGLGEQANPKVEKQVWRPVMISSSSATLDTVMILVERPFEGNDPTVGTSIGSESSPGSSQANIQGSLAANSQILIPDDPSELNYLGLRPRPPVIRRSYNRANPTRSSYPRSTPNKRKPKRPVQNEPKIKPVLIAPVIIENDRKSVARNPLSTFSIDVDQASYTNLRASVNNDLLPPAKQIRTEELINYFNYQYPQPQGDHPIALDTEVSPCPWNPRNQIVRISLKAKEVQAPALPPSNYVFLIDVSGSMAIPQSLPLVKTGLKKMVKNLRPIDKVSIVVYASASGVVLPPTPGDEQKSILKAINQLDAGGSTNGGEGIKLAYKLAAESFIEDGNNRVILCTDGDFNLGLTSTEDLTELIKAEREKDVFLSAIRVGSSYGGNDPMMERISNHGNGVYYYLDSEAEAEKIFVGDFLGTIYTVAKDVKLQIEFNPQKVNAYRLIGYEDRLLANADFSRDSVDAGDMGSGHRVTALYEITPYIDPNEAIASHYQGSQKLRYADENLKHSLELLTVNFRYKQPDQDTSLLLSQSLSASISPFDGCSFDHRWATSVAECSMLLRGSYFVSESNFEQAIGRAYAAAGDIPERLSFIELVISAQEIKASQENP